MRRRRLQLLLSNNIGLIAYCLPLDAPPVYGHNAQPARVLGIDIVDGFGAAAGPAIGRYGRLREPVSAAAFAQRVADRLGRLPLHVAAGPEQIATIGFWAGAAQDYLEQAAALGPRRLSQRRDIGTYRASGAGTRYSLLRGGASCHGAVWRAGAG